VLGIVAAQRRCTEPVNDTQREKRGVNLLAVIVAHPDLQMLALHCGPRLPNTRCLGTSRPWRARHELGVHYIAAGQPKLASDGLEAARLLFVQLGDLAGQARVRQSMASAASMLGDYRMADDQIDLGRSLARQHGDPRVAVSVELRAGALLEERYESAAAADVYRGALALAAGPLYADLRALCHMNIGDAESGRNYRTAVEEYSEAATAYSQIGDTVNELRARAAHIVALSKVGDESAIDLADEIVASLSRDLDQDVRSDVYLARASALTELGRYGEALKALSDPAIADMGMEPTVQRLDLLSVIGRFGDVVAEIDPIIERAPYCAYLYSLKGWSLLNLDPPAAEAALAAATARDN
jgi:tetratricopeptide (TPR) repeat protein